MTQRLRVIDGGKPSIFDDPEALKRQTAEALAKRGLSAAGLRMAPNAAPAKRGARATFVMVPHVWIDRLVTDNAPLGVWKLALALLYRANLGERFELTNAILVKVGVGRDHKRSLLARLETLGLVSVEWRGRQTPLVTVLCRRERVT